MKKYLIAVFVVFVGIFFALRLPSIYYEQVPYTYDQGRDFKAVRNIVQNADITLIGPTTGAQGVFHGPWWYYGLAAPFIATGGSPTAFYYFITFLAFGQGLLFWYFLQNEGYDLLGLAFFAIIAVSPYFIRMSVFAINSVMTLPFILLLMYGLFAYFAKDRLIDRALIGLSIGMIIEAEVAFGIFLVPAFFLAIALTRNIKNFFGSVKKSAYFFGALFVALIARIVFELKNNFLQTRALFSFTDSTPTEPKTWIGVFSSRLDLFKGYYTSIFDERIEVLGWLLLVGGVIGFALGYRKLRDEERKFVSFVGIMTVLLFLLSLIYKDSAFWPYYFEGIQYIFVVLVLFGVLAIRSVKQKLAITIFSTIIGVMVFVGGLQLYDVVQADEPRNIGLRMHTKAIGYLSDQVGSEEFCLRMYTPPVLTHTYDYLLDYTTRQKDFIYPHTSYTNNECWYFIESDDGNPERRDAWIDENIPTDAVLVQEYEISDYLVIQKYSLHPEDTSMDEAELNDAPSDN